MRNIIIFTTIAVITILYGCERYDIKGMIASSSKKVDIRFEESMAINAKNQCDTLIKTKGTEYRIYIASDFHVTTSAQNIDRYLYYATKDTNNVCTMILGDITDQKDGHKIASDTLAKYNNSTIRYVTGNHDLYFNQWETYKEHFGSSSYYFVIETDNAKDLFICLDSGSGTLGKKQSDWIKNILKSKRAHYRHCMIMTHTNFFDTDLSQFPTGSFSTEETIMLSGMFSKYNVDYVISGHDHTRDISELNGVKYITSDEMKNGSKKASYIIIDINNQIHYTFIDFR